MNRQDAKIAKKKKEKYERQFVGTVPSITETTHFQCMETALSWLSSALASKHSVLKDGIRRVVLS